MVSFLLFENKLWLHNNNSCVKDAEEFHSAGQTTHPIDQQAGLLYTIQTAQEARNHMHYSEEDTFKEVANEKCVK